MVTQINGTIGLVLHGKNSQAVWTVAPEETVYAAVEKMADREIGALLVLSEGKLMGIISERDYARKVILKHRSSRLTFVQEIMTSPVIIARPNQPVSDCMTMMTQHRIRHLPIVENERILGIVSIGDIVKWIIDEQEHMIEELNQYISSGYPG